MNPAPSRATLKNSSSRFKKFKERIIEDSSVRRNIDQMEQANAKGLVSYH